MSPKQKTKHAAPAKAVLTAAIVAALVLTPLAFIIAGVTGGVPAGVSAGPGSIKAGEEDCAYICAELGILRGEGHGVTDEYLAKKTQRIQAAYLTLRLVGKESEAENYKGADNFNDVSHIYEGGQRRTAYLKANSAKYGWQGDGTNRLMPNDDLTAQQFYKVLLTVLGYQANVDYPYADTLAYAEKTTGMKECRYISGALINDDIAVMLVEALMSYMRGETYTLAEFLAEESVIDYDRAIELGVIGRSDIIEVTTPPSPTPTPTPAPPATLQGEIAAPTNFAEIDVKFNQKVGLASIDRNYIKIDDGPLLATDQVRLLEDGATVRIYREAGFVAQQGQRKKISVSKIRSEDNRLEMAPIAAYEIAFYDNQTPTLVDVQAVGLRRVKLVFSEPLRQTDSAVRNYATYRFNGKVMPASDGVFCNGREVYLNFSSKLEAGANKLTIDRNRIYDLAGFPIIDIADYEFDAAEDTDAPQVLTVDAWREKVVVTFSEEIRESSVRLYWLDGNVRRNSQTGAKDFFDRNIITFAFLDSQYMTAGPTEIVIEGISDMNGNAGADYRATVNPRNDTERPVVTEVSSTGANEIVVCFSKPVKLGTANANRFTLKNSNNVTISVNVQSHTPSGASAPDPRYIKLTGGIPSGTYTLTVANVEDTTAQANKSVESTHSVMVADKAPPVVVSVSANIAGSKVVLVFNKDLDWNSATEPSSYQYYVPGRGHIAVPSGTTAFLEGDGRTVVLTFPPAGWAVGGGAVSPSAFTLYVATSASDELRVLNVMDTNMNAMEPTLVDVPGTNEVAAKLLPSVYAVTAQRLMMRFEASGSLPINAASQDFIVRAGSQNLPFRSMGYGSINAAAREMYIDFDSFELNPDATYGSAHTPVTVAMVQPNQVGYTKTALGTPLEIQGGATVQATDNIKPGILEAFRGNRAAGPSSLVSGVSYPALTYNQVLIVINEKFKLQSITSADALSSIMDIKTESQPNSALNPSSYEVVALSESNANVSLSSAVEARMILVTLKTAVNEAVNVSIRANTMWDGNYDAGGSNVLNGSFETGYLAPVS